MKHRLPIFIIILSLPPFLGISQTFNLNRGCFERMVLTNEKQINTKGLETFPQYINDTLAFINGLDGGKDYQIVRGIDKNEDGWKTVMPLHKSINSPYFEGPFSFDAKNQKLFFTRSNFNKKKANKESARQKDSVVFQLSIYEYDWAKGGEAKKININRDDYTVCDPAVSPDGEWMVFSSDIPGGMGGRDLYLVRRDEQDWVGMINLGSGINSQSNDGFPYFANDKLLFFASDREGGLGGFDIYYSVVENGLWSLPELMPKPVNSPYDDIGFIVASNEREGYLATNRPGGKGEDDLYHWSSTQSIWRTVLKDEDVEVDVFVFEKLTLLPFPEAKITITLLDISRQDFSLDDPNVDIVNLDTTGAIYLKWNNLLDGNKGIELITNDKGGAKIKLKSNRYYKVEGSCEICEPEIVFFKPMVHGKQLNIALVPDVEIEEEDEDMDKDDSILDVELKPGSAYVLENIFYDYDSDQIINEGINDLDIIAEKMEDNPSMRILLEAHTDVRGNESYNLSLSKKRANTAKNYLIGKGIDANRILTKGMGELRPRNKCKEGVKCSEKDHQYNRRTEVVILPEE
ncbi:MAG: OmpA family protein [Saprospiraceae bacterium]